MQISIIDQGINLMLYGMGTVFLFLTLLVFATWFMSWLVQLIGVEAPDSVEDSSVKINIGSTPTADKKTLSILQAAINKHLNKD